MDNPAPDRREIARAQQRLSELGYRPGPIDGLAGPAFADALTAFQWQAGFVPSGVADANTLAALHAADAPGPDPQPQPAGPGRVIDEQEAEAYIGYFQAALQAADERGRRAAIGEGLMQFGMAFVSALLRFSRDADPQMQAFAEEVSECATDWLSGTRLTERADEDERRARFALSLLDMGPHYRGMTRLVMSAVLQLPKGDPLRDEQRILTVLQDWLARLRRSGDISGMLLTIGHLLAYETEDQQATSALIEEGLAVVDDCDEWDIRRNYLVTVAGYFVGRLIELRDAGGDPAASPLAGEVKALCDRLDALGGEARIRHKNAMLRGLYLEVTGEDRAAAEVFEAASRSAELDEDTRARMARVAAKKFLLIGEDRRVVELLEPVAAVFEQAYLAAVEPSEVASAGDDFAEAQRLLAFACARSGDWAGAWRHQEHDKSLRLRYRIALRRSERGAELLDYEARLHALGRGVDVDVADLDAFDAIGADVSLQRRALEHYRRLRPGLHDALLDPVEWRALADALGPGEAAVSLGTGSFGTVVCAVTPGADRESLQGRHFPDWTSARIGEAMGGGEALDGWLFAIGDRLRQIDGRAPLERVLEALDADIGGWIAATLGRRGIRRIHLACEGMLAFAPLWLLPSLSAFEVVLTPCAAYLRETLAAPAARVRAGLAIGDPTGDLPVSAAEVALVREAFEARAPELSVTTIEREDADEPATVEASRVADLVHFCGHGVADLTEPLRSGLLLHPRWGDLPVDSPQALEAAAKGAEWRVLGDDERGASLPGMGFLHEWRDQDDGELHQRHLEYAEHGTLWINYRDGRPLRCAELWSAGDMAVQGSLGHCALAVLSACKGGLGGFSPANETTGVPAALLLAGVGTVVVALWPVSDLASVLFAERFYTRLRTTRGVLEIPALVKWASEALRDMDKASAAERVGALRERTPDRWTRFRLEAYARRLAQGQERPFAHPYDWGAFCVYGRTRVSIGGAAP